MTSAPQRPLLLVNARIVNEGRIFDADVRIEGERIALIGPQLSANGAEVVDLAGSFLLPGLIDDQVHFRDPGMPHKATIATESRAALAGGVTSFFDMPNTSPATVDLAQLRAKRGIAGETSHANWAFYLGATNTNIEEVRRVGPELACGVKVFMGASTGNMLVDDPDTLDRIFADAPVPVAVHCEDTPMILEAERRFRERYGDDVPITAHPEIRSAEACFKSSSMAVDLARRHGTQLHVLHLTTERELVLFSPGAVEDKNITVEACVHHLWFDQTDYPALGTRIKCNPAIKRPEDRAALLEAVRNGTIDVIATDHAPHTLEEKARPYFEAPAGLPLVQHLLPALLELHSQGEFTLELIVEKTAHNPARRFRAIDRGFIREGYFADLVAVNLEGQTQVSDQNVLYRCGWSPFAGQTFRGAVQMTILNGQPVYRDGQIVGAPRGQALQFGRCR
jgi:dihydroorotase